MGLDPVNHDFLGSTIAAFKINKYWGGGLGGGEWGGGMWGGGGHQCIVITHSQFKFPVYR